MHNRYLPSFHSESVSRSSSIKAKASLKSKQKNRKLFSKWTRYALSMACLLILYFFFKQSGKIEEISQVRVKEEKKEEKKEAVVLSEYGQLGCSKQSEHCWAAIYHSIDSQASFLLKPDGQLTVTGLSTGSLSWYNDSSHLTFRDKKGNIWGDFEALLFDFDDSEEKKLFRDRSNETVKLIEDKQGFIFTESVYELWVSSTEEGLMNDGKWVRIIFQKDCMIYSSDQSEALGSWEDCGMPQKDSFLGIKIKVSKEDFKVYSLRTLNHGLEWWQDPPRGSPARARPILILRLAQPKVVQEIAYFPLTPFIKPYLKNLVEDGGETSPFTKTDERSNPKKPSKILAIYSPQLDCDTDNCPQPFSFVIAVASNLENPKGNTGLYKCKVGERWMKGWWISWSTVICAIGSLSADIIDTPVDLSIWMRGFEVANGRKIDLGYAFRPRTKGLWMVHQGRHLENNKWEQHDLSICTMIKDEAKYLEEWFNYHATLGIGQFYIYDNGPGAKLDKDTSRILDPWVRRGFATVIQWPYKAAQTQALTDCLNRFRHSTRWLTFVDVDEFIDPMASLPIAQPRIKDQLLSILEPNGPGSGPDTHCMPWVSYCKKDQIEEPKRGVLFTYNQIAPVPESVVQRIHMQKPIFLASSAMALRAIGPHFLLYFTSDPMQQNKVNLRCPTEWADPNVFRLRHYRSKSREEYVERRRGGDAAYKSRVYSVIQLEEEWEEENKLCTLEASAVL